jgi:hypothetical protein
VVIAVRDERGPSPGKGFIEGAPEFPVVIAVGDKRERLRARAHRGVSKDPSGNCGRR